MMHFIYLACLLVALSGMAIIDWRYKLALFHDRRRTLMVVGVMTAVFLLWDAFGIGLGIFIYPGSPYSLPFTLLPEFPLEEIVFLIHLSYTTLVVYLGMERVWRRIPS